MKRKFLIFAMFLFAFSIGYAANGNEEFLKGNNFLEQKKYKEAEKYFFEALKKGNPNAYNALSYLYYVQGNFEKAEYYFLKDLNTITDEEEKKIVKYNLAFLYVKQNKEEKAEKMLRSIKNDDIFVYYFLEDMYYKNVDYKNALKYSKKALEKGNKFSINDIVVISNKSKKSDNEVMELVKQEYEKGNIYAYGFYGLIIKNTNLKEGEKICKLGIEKGDPNSYSCMSVILFDQGRKEESKKMFEKYKFEIERLSENLRKEILK